MTKKIASLLLTLILLNACTQKPESVTLTVNQKSITDTSLTLLLENNLKEEIMYGEFYEIKVKDSGTWKKLDAIDDVFFTHLGHHVSPNKKQTIKLNWRDFYGHLTPGTYRIEKTFTKENDHTEQQLIAEFDVE